METCDVRESYSLQVKAKMEYIEALQRLVDEKTASNRTFRASVAELRQELKTALQDPRIQEHVTCSDDDVMADGGASDRREYMRRVKAELQRAESDLRERRASLRDSVHAALTARRKVFREVEQIRETVEVKAHLAGMGDPELAGLGVGRGDKELARLGVGRRDKELAGLGVGRVRAVTETLQEYTAPSRREHHTMYDTLQELLQENAARDFATSQNDVMDSDTPHADVIAAYPKPDLPDDLPEVGQTCPSSSITEVVGDIKPAAPSVGDLISGSQPMTKCDCSKGNADDAIEADNEDDSIDDIHDVTEADVDDVIEADDEEIDDESESDDEESGDDADDESEADESESEDGCSDDETDDVRERNKHGEPISDVGTDIEGNHDAAATDDVPKDHDVVHSDDVGDDVVNIYENNFIRSSAIEEADTPENLSYETSSCDDDVSVDESNSNVHY